MPFRKQFVDPETGAVYPDAYWYPDIFNLSVTSKSLSLTYVAVVNQESALKKRPLDRAVRTYPFADVHFAALLAQLAQKPSTSEPLAVQLANLMDDLAISYEDVRKPDGSGFESFFADAERVAADLSILG